MYLEQAGFSVIAASDGATGSGVASVRLSNDGLTWSDWTTMTVSRAWTLPAGDGTKSPNRARSTSSPPRVERS